MSFVLKFTPDPSDGIGKWAPNQGPWFLVRLGEQWPHNPARRLIHETALDSIKARVFATEEDALACWAEAGSPRGWECVPNVRHEPRGGQGFD